MGTRSDLTTNRPAFPPPISDEERETETDQSWPAIGVVTQAQARGAVLWGLLGGAAGLVIGAVVGLIPFADLAMWPRVGLVALVAALAGATVGAVLGGGREAELEEDVGNQIGPPPLIEEIRDPAAARRAVEDVRSASKSPGGPADR